MRGRKPKLSRLTIIIPEKTKNLFARYAKEKDTNTSRILREQIAIILGKKTNAEKNA